MLQPLFVKNQPSQPVKNTIPYLLHLSGMSEILLQPIVTVFLDLCKIFKLFDFPI